MRKFLFGLLLAGAATPAFAAAGPRHHDDNDDRSRRQEERAERPARAERSDRAQARPRFDRSDRSERRVDVQRPQFSGGYGRPDRPQLDRVQPVMRENPYAGDRRRSSDAPDSVRNWRPREQRGQQGGYIARRIDRPDGVRIDRDARQQFSGGYQQRDRWTNGQRYGRTQQVRVDSRNRDRSNWNHNWRNDRRYDWRNWRNQHRSRFHVGVYFDPFGWNYQRFSVGWRLQPGYYSNRYWINDPWMYRLPYAPPGTQWVRYWNDALLVDLYSGEVVDVINNFFW
ncbi:Ni/Co efflux regulator RcnB [Sphingomonas sp. F9_3S_D5_B_2]